MHGILSTVLQAYETLTEARYGDTSAYTGRLYQDLMGSEAAWLHSSQTIFA